MKHIINWIILKAGTIALCLSVIAMTIVVATSGKSKAEIPGRYSLILDTTDGTTYIIDTITGSTVMVLANSENIYGDSTHFITLPFKTIMIEELKQKIDDHKNRINDCKNRINDISIFEKEIIAIEKKEEK